MSNATLTFAPHVGVFIAADRFDDGLLAICLAAGTRGEHNVIVLDPARAFAAVATFAIPNRARSGITRVLSAGSLLITGDDHVLSAFRGRTGELVWRRSFPAPDQVRLVTAESGRVLAWTKQGDGPATTRILHAHDGTDERVLEDVGIAGAFCPALGPNGELAIPYLRAVQIVPADAPARHIDIAARKFGVVDTALFDETGERLAMGTRAGETIVADVKAGTTESLVELDFENPVRCVGFVRGRLWAMDASGKLRIAGEPGAVETIDLGLSTYGGLLAPDGSSIALSDLDTRTFRVRALPSGEELFSTSSGFQCQSVEVDGDGSLVVGGPDSVVRIGQGRAQKIGATSAETIRRLPTGALLFDDQQLMVLAPGAKKPVRVGRAIDGFEPTPDGTRVVVSGDSVIEVWELASRTRLSRIDLGATWVGETNEAIDTAYLAPDGQLIVHLTNGAVWRVAELDKESGFLGSLPKTGSLHLHPDGQSLFHVERRSLTRIRIGDYREMATLHSPVDADLSTIRFSPSGKRLCAFHRNGQLASIDVESGRGVCIGTETSAAERAPNEVFIMDLQVPRQCAFSRDERRIVWTTGGALSFADAETGAIVGRLVIATGAKDYVVTDGESFDWSGKKTAISPEIHALVAGRRLSAEELTERRRPGLLADLT